MKSYKNNPHCRVCFSQHTRNPEGHWLYIDVSDLAPCKIIKGKHLVVLGKGDAFCSFGCLNDLMKKEGIA